MGIGWGMDEGAGGCVHDAALLQDLIDGELSVAQRESVEAHLGACPHCRALVLELRRNLAATRVAMAPGPGAALEAPEALVQAIVERRLKGTPEGC